MCHPPSTVEVTPRTLPPAIRKDALTRPRLIVVSATSASPSTRPLLWQSVSPRVPGQDVRHESAMALLEDPYCSSNTTMYVSNILSDARTRTTLRFFGQ
ncbi:hypothetical protein BDP55DRAFT_346838 [Colletotrichum godetiae]|uniref:Uncharacterized protein n=1 Tax=Colletotrichum godetiae TaxID=1209918 RepID=A0AAJ0AU20_9PEZI|nr:uncharacterized protein BDP55DRAFT_346838 [Colletotrichum godetiae]KAK1690366.1 hypothetical protein BDP55DRAFT_346838 [Colletotrichum godetiae]